MNKQFEIGDLIRKKLTDQGDLLLILEVIYKDVYRYINISYFIKSQRIFIGKDVFEPDYWRKIDKT